MNKVEFSKEQANIIAQVAEIYKKNLEPSITAVNKGEITKVQKDIIGGLIDDNIESGKEVSILSSMGIDLSKAYEDDWFKHHDLISTPEIINEFSYFDVILIKFISLNWVNEIKCDEWDLAQLIVKLNILLELKSQENG